MQARAEIQSIDKTVQRMERDETVARLKKHVGKFYRHAEDPMRGVPRYYYVLGVDKGEQRNRVVEIHRYGRGPGAWYSIEVTACIYDMGKQTRMSRKQFMKLYREAIKAVKIPKGR